jgi:hypothetical protein
VPEDDYQELLRTMEQYAERERLAQNAVQMSQAAKNLQGQTQQGSPLAQLTGSAA